MNNADKRFDEKFGKDGLDTEISSIGRVAGCDDCEENQAIRSEHKLFVHQELRNQAKEIIRIIKMMRPDADADGLFKNGFYEALEQAKKEIEK